MSIIKRRLFYMIRSVGASTRQSVFRFPGLRGVKGFTLMEVMVSVSIFTIIMVIGIGSLLVINTSNSQSRADREAIDRVSFLLESLTRKIRTGVLDPSSTAYDLRFVNQDRDKEEYQFIGLSGTVGTLQYSVTRCGTVAPTPCAYANTET